MINIDYGYKTWVAFINEGTRVNVLAIGDCPVHMMHWLIEHNHDPKTLNSSESARIVLQFHESPWAQAVEEAIGVIHD